ncbi:MAG: hypothetical protein KDD50_14315 [Bdellovibrionales bacterium]|nr:hypothetical protein [Bdellovibrionales bacterium]
MVSNRVYKILTTAFVVGIFTFAFLNNSRSEDKASVCNADSDQLYCAEQAMKNTQGITLLPMDASCVTKPKPGSDSNQLISYQENYLKCRENRKNQSKDDEKRKECKEQKKEIKDALKEFNKSAAEAKLKCSAKGDGSGSCEDLMQRCRDASDIEADDAAEECPSILAEGADAKKEAYDEAHENLTKFKEAQQKKDEENQSSQQEKEAKIKQLQFALIDLEKALVDLDRTRISNLKKLHSKRVAQENQYLDEIDQLQTDMDTLHIEKYEREQKIEAEKVENINKCWDLAYEQMQEKRKFKLSRRSNGRTKSMTAGTFFRNYKSGLQSLYDSWIKKEFKECTNKPQYNNTIEQLKKSITELEKVFEAKKETLKKKEASLKRIRNKQKGDESNELEEAEFAYVSKKEQIILDKEKTRNAIVELQKALSTMSQSQSQRKATSFQEEFKLQTDMQLAQAKYAGIQNSGITYSLKENTVADAIYAWDTYKDAYDDIDQECKDKPAESDNNGLVKSGERKSGVK